MKTRIALDQAAMIGVLRDALPIFGYSLDSAVSSPVQVKYGAGDQPRYCVREVIDTSKIMVSVNICANAPWLPEGSYRSILPCDLHELREILRQGQLVQGVVAEMLTFEVRRVLGNPHLVAEYIA